MPQNKTALYTINMKTYSTSLKALVMCYYYLCLYTVTGDTLVYTPPEFRRAPGEMGAHILSVPNSNFPPRDYHVPRQQIIRTAAMQSQPVPKAEKVQTENSLLSFNDFLNVIKGDGTSDYAEDENQKMRTTTHEDDVNKYKKAPPNDYTRQNYDSWTPSIHESASSYVPSATIQHQSTNKASPKFNLLEPVTTKMSSKVNGLMSLVLAFLGSGSDSLLMKGFKDVIIDGIVKPLLVAKGGLKVLISKLTIPVISLLLINIEVLITVWWLWDDCAQTVPYKSTYPQPTPYQPAYSQPVTENYSYNTTYI